MENKFARGYTKMLLTGALGLCTTLSAHPVRQKIDENWLFKQVRGYNSYTATVPGVVHTDLMDNGIIEDPFFRLNERGVQWVDKEDWEYRTEIDPLPEIFAKERIQLYFEGLDTYADVYLNDSLILQANNMFREWRVDVKGLLKKSGNRLRIYFHSPIKTDIPKFDALHYRNDAGNDQSQNGGIFDKQVSVFARKAGYHYGWDWGPRLVTSGIWQPVWLEGWNDLRIESAHYRQDRITAEEARITARVEILSERDGKATLHIRTGNPDESWTKTVTVRKGRNMIEQEMAIEHPRLWWTNGLGEPHLYDFTASVTAEGGETASRTDRIGLRELKVIREKDEAGRSFCFQLNGVRLFAKGANYIPQDNFLPRVSDRQYERTILDAVNANMNMLRIWGGGIYENDIFYDLCDRYGILVWQDFMFACNTYPLLPGTADNIRQEATDNVKRLRNHPCIALWCGNNEMHTAWFGWGWMKKYERMGVLDEMRNDYKTVFHEILPEVVAEYDPTAFYWPSSPYGGNPDAGCESGKPNWNPEGDAHYWGVWHRRDSIGSYNHYRARFFSEYGFQSFPEYESVLKYAPDTADHHIFSEVMMAHQRGGSHANARIEWYLLNEYRKPKDFRNFLYMGLLLQGDAVRTAIEAHRRDMPYCMGSLFWQHNDCWPVASWSSRDYYGRWKAQHYFARKAFADILVSPIAEDDDLRIYVVSDRLRPVKGKLSVRILDLYGRPVRTYSRTVTLPANTSKCHLSVPLAEALHGKKRNEVVVNAVFTAQNGETFDNNYYLTRFKEIDFPRATLTTDITACEGGFLVTIASDVVARGVFLSTEDSDNFFSDNYFDLLPGESETIRVETRLEEADFRRRLRCKSICDAY